VYLYLNIIEMLGVFKISQHKRIEPKRRKIFLSRQNFFDIFGSPEFKKKKNLTNFSAY